MKWIDYRNIDKIIHNINNLRCKDVKFKYEIDRLKEKP